MEAMDGPINFGPRDTWWGLLVEGFEFQPLYGNPYNPPYYKELFKSYNVPEFMVKPVSISRKDWQQAIEAPARRATYEP